MISEKQRIELGEALGRLKEALDYAIKELSLLSLIASGIKVDPEEIDILNAEVLIKE